MSKFFVLLLFSIFKISVCCSQSFSSIRCNMPTCEEPGDPGLSSTIRNQLFISSNAVNKKITVSFKEFLGAEVTVILLNKNGLVLQSRDIKIDTENLEVSFNLKKSAEDLFSIKVVSFDREYVADVSFSQSYRSLKPMSNRSMNNVVKN